MEEQEGQHLTAFNQGYLIAKLAPKLAKSLSNSLSPDIEFTKTILSGIKEYEREKNKALTKSEKPKVKDVGKGR